jgi:hypothetical protein
MMKELTMPDVRQFPISAGFQHQRRTDATHQVPRTRLVLVGRPLEDGRWNRLTAGLDIEVHRAWSQADIAIQCTPGTNVVVIVSSIVVGPALDELLAQIQSLGLKRCIVFGPEFGSLEHQKALDQGFDEAWPAGLSDEMLRRLLARQAIPAGSQRATQEHSFVRSDSERDASWRGLILKHEGREIFFGGSYGAILSLLVTRSPALVTRTEIESYLTSSGGRKAESRVADVTISRMRRLLDAEGVSNVLIASVRSKGYRLVNRLDATLAVVPATA